MRRAFTLVELMISVILLSIIVTFLYQSVAQLQNSNQKLIKSTNKTLEREDLLKVLYNDFINLTSLDIIDKSDDTDVLVLQSTNSFYKMSMPYVRYMVDNDAILRRIESAGVQLDYENSFFRFDTLATEVKTLKVYEKDGHYFIYVKSDNMQDIYLDIIPPALGSKNEEDNTSKGSEAGSQKKKEGETS